MVETEYSRAASGGVGSCKNAGNYAASLVPTKRAIEQGFDQVLCTDAETHEYIEEAAIANLMFFKNEKLIVPDSPNVLKGITRDSVIALANHLQFEIEKRSVKISQLIDGINEDSVNDVFATGTAAKIAQIEMIGYKGQIFQLTNTGQKKSDRLLDMLDAINRVFDVSIAGFSLPLKKSTNELTTERNGTAEDARPSVSISCI